MGIGRREFLKFAAMALGGMALDPLGAVTVHGNYYINSRLGLGFEKPEGWHFDAFKDFGTLLKGQVVENIEPNDEEAFRRDQTSTLLAVISKYDLNVPRFGPSITVFKNEEDKADYDSIDDLMDAALQGCALLLKDFKVIESPTVCELSNCRCIRFKSRWLFQHNKIPSTLIDDETLVLDQGNVLYTVHLYDAPGTGESASGEFRQFVRSLRLA